MEDMGPVFHIPPVYDVMEVSGMLSEFVDGGIVRSKIPERWESTLGEAITISTYGHCRDRAHSYLLGASDFVKTARGPKIRAFYFNILDPLDRAHVTIDGHMVAAYRANTGTMKENIVRKREYEEVARACKRLASYMNLIPNQLQATIWFARKRILNIKFDPQLDLFAGVDNAWKTVVDINSIKPY